MFEFMQRTEGFLVVHKASGKPIADITTRTLGLNNDPRFKVPERTNTPIKKDDWIIHFTAATLKPAELAAFAQELAALTDD